MTATLCHDVANRAPSRFVSFSHQRWLVIPDADLGALSAPRQKSHIPGRAIVVRAGSDLTSTRRQLTPPILCPSRSGSPRGQSGSRPDTVPACTRVRQPRSARADHLQATTSGSRISRTTSRGARISRPRPRKLSAPRSPKSHQDLSHAREDGPDDRAGLKVPNATDPRSVYSAGCSQKPRSANRDVPPGDQTPSHFVRE
jgi:hypothetical protein